MSAYNILCLDDNPQRLAAFRQKLIGNVVTLVSTAHGAITKLKLYQYAIVFLDFDLDQFGGKASETGNGMDVVSWVVKNKNLFRTTHFIVHSLNPIGGPLMYSTLKAAGLQAELLPGVWEDTKFLEAV